MSVGSQVCIRQRWGTKIRSVCFKEPYYLSDKKISCNNKTDHTGEVATTRSVVECHLDYSGEDRSVLERTLGQLLFLLQAMSCESFFKALAKRKRCLLSR